MEMSAAHPLKLHLDTGTVGPSAQSVQPTSKEREGGSPLIRRSVKECAATFHHVFENTDISDHRNVSQFSRKLIYPNDPGQS